MGTAIVCALIIIPAALIIEFLDIRAEQRRRNEK